jgi:hypothetical protein
MKKKEKEEQKREENIDNRPLSVKAQEHITRYPQL